MTPEWVRLPVFADRRGSLSVIDHDQHLPFAVRRQFMVYGVPTGAIRGQHANRLTQEVLFCVRGSVVVTLDDSIERASVTLDNPAIGLHLPSMTWSEQLQFSSDAVVVVLASHPYDPADAISDYQVFLSLCGRRSALRLA